MKIVKIHGNSGSGKSSIVYNLFDNYGRLPLYNFDEGHDPKKPEAYRVDIPGVHSPTFVLGRYETACGGVDTILNAKILIALIEKYAPLGNVIYEGLLISTYYGTAGAAMAKYGDNHVWAFLDTPLEVCIERVKARRLAAGNDKPFNEANTRKRHLPIDNLRHKLIRQGSNVVLLDHTTDPTDQIVSLLP